MSLTSIHNFAITKKLCRKLCFDVYQAENAFEQQQVWLKVLDENLAKDETHVFNYLNGARLCRLLVSDNICKVMGFGYEEGRYIIISESIDGRSLSLQMDEEFPMSLKQCKEVILGIAQILRAVHLQGVVHGLLNPSSIYSTKAGFKIDDFGYTWVVPILLSSSRGESAELSYYMSPEVFFQTHQIDGRADIYSLGVILLQMLTESSGFEGHAKATFRNKQLLSYVPKVKRIFPQNAELLERILLRTLCRTPEGRYQNMKEFIEDLQRIKEEAPVAGISRHPNGTHSHPYPNGH